MTIFDLEKSKSKKKVKMNNITPLPKEITDIFTQAAKAGYKNSMTQNISSTRIDGESSDIGPNIISIKYSKPEKTNVPFDINLTK